MILGVIFFFVVKNSQCEIENIKNENQRIKEEYEKKHSEIGKDSEVKYNEMKTMNQKLQSEIEDL